MAKIKQLPPHEAQKIAAGEVVERPANIVKELIENAIDANATRIAVYVEDGGKQLIRIVDNGCGMDTTDAQLCFDRHATSKITHVSELETIDTFGFRGEALASIASVSVITLMTKEEHALEGTKVIVNANSITGINSVACVTGTDITVQNLFFNVPARKKFLKATQTEWRAIQLLFNAFCFDYPHIHFLLFSESKQIFNCPTSTNLKNRALQIWESQSLLRSASYEGQANNHLLDVHVTEKDFSLSGVISDHQYYRYDRSSIYFFVNKRWVKNQHISNAFIKGYANVIPAGRYPAGIIHITVPTHEVDINIHPRKEEVKFLHPRRIEQALQQAVKNALEKNLSQHLKKNVTFNSAPSFAEASDFAKASSDRSEGRSAYDFTPFNFDTPFAYSESPLYSAPFDTLPTGALRASGLENSHTTSSPLEFDSSPLALSVFASKNVSKGSEINNSQIAQLDLQTQPHTNISFHTTPEPVTPYRLIGQYNTTYILVEKKDGLFLVDQHAAHERILYELFSQRFEEVATIQLLFPHIITLSPHDINIITPHLDIFTNNGIIIEQCASDQLKIESLPVHLKDQSLDDIIKTTVSWIIESNALDQQELKKMINNKLQAQMACKAAVKAGDLLTQEKMEQLLHDLEKTANRFSCPHGRPTGWLLSLHEIEKKFKRRI
jgi:DNA mismatch repair protein MutL